MARGTDSRGWGGRSGVGPPGRVAPSASGRAPNGAVDLTNGAEVIGEMGDAGDAENNDWDFRRHAGQWSASCAAHRALPTPAGTAESGCRRCPRTRRRHRPGRCRLSGERHALRRQSGELARDVGHLEGGDRNALREHRFLKRLAGRIGIRFQGQLQVVRPFGRGDRDPSVLADRNVVLLLEPQDLRVEPERLAPGRPP